MWCLLLQTKEYQQMFNAEIVTLPNLQYIDIHNTTHDTLYERTYFILYVVFWFLHVVYNWWILIISIMYVSIFENEKRKEWNFLSYKHTLIKGYKDILYKTTIHVYNVFYFYCA